MLQFTLSELALDFRHPERSAVPRSSSFRKVDTVEWLAALLRALNSLLLAQQRFIWGTGFLCARQHFGGGGGLPEDALLKEKRHIDQTNHHGHFDEWPNHSGKRRAAVDTKDGHRHRDCQFKIVAGGCERQRRGLRVIRADGAPHEERYQNITTK